MSDALLLPCSTGDAVDLAAGSRLWRKQILKKGSVVVNGKKIEFDDAWCADLAAAFNDGAYDQVAFQLVDGQNNHTLDPERFRGEVKAVIQTDDGLDAVLQLSEDGDRMVRDNPRLGVSCGIREGVGRFGRAIQHVAATLDPRVRG